jgi:hypothetical protein
MYKRHIVIRQEVDIHEARDKAIEKKIYVKYRSTRLRVQVRPRPRIHDFILYIQ